MKQLENLRSALNAVYKAFQYEEGERVYPVDDRTDMFWFINGNKVQFAPNENDLKSKYDHFENLLFEDHKGKVEYDGDEYVMLCVDDQAGNRFLQIFSKDRKREPKKASKELTV